MRAKRAPRPLTDEDGEVRELTAEDLARFRPGSEALPERVLRAFGRRGTQKAPTKRLVSLRLSAEVVEHYKAGGPGWQTRIDQTLKRAVARARSTER